MHYLDDRPELADERPQWRLGRAVARMRKQARLSQRELARLVTISEGYIPRIESGRVRPDPSVLREIARVTGGNATELLTAAGFTFEREWDDEKTAEDLHHFRALPARLRRGLLAAARAMLSEDEVDEVERRRRSSQERGTHTGDQHSDDQDRGQNTGSQSG